MVHEILIIIHMSKQFNWMWTAAGTLRLSKHLLHLLQLHHPLHKNAQVRG
jgi:hypothetical protein